jgi:hypothetical protein
MRPALASWPTRFVIGLSLVVTLLLVNLQPLTLPAAAEGVSLVVPLIAQRFEPADNNGDVGVYDCLAASVSMVLQSLQAQGKLAEGATDYQSVRLAFRNVSPDVNWGLRNDLPTQVVPALTNDVVQASWFAGPTDQTWPAYSWQEFLSQQLAAGYPVIASIPDWRLLAGENGYPGAAGHSVVITGLVDGQVVYNDPWTAQEYRMSTDEFAAAWSNSGGSGYHYGAVTFLSSRSPEPAGRWIAPDDSVSTTGLLHLAVEAYPAGAGDPAIDHVDFRVRWSQPATVTDPWTTAFVATAPASGDTYEADVDLAALGAPSGEVWFSFDVYDSQGNQQDSPDGQRRVVFEPPPTPTPSPTPSPTVIPSPTSSPTVAPSLTSSALDVAPLPTPADQPLPATGAEAAPAPTSENSAGIDLGHAVLSASIDELKKLLPFVPYVETRSSSTGAEMDLSVSRQLVRDKSLVLTLSSSGVDYQGPPLPSWLKSGWKAIRQVLH